MNSWGKIWTKRYRKTEKTNCHRVSGAKADYWARLAEHIHTPPERWANHWRRPSGRTPANTLTLTPCKELAHSAPWGTSKETITSFCSSPLQPQGPKENPAWISCLASSKFLLMGNSQEPRLVPLPFQILLSCTLAIAAKIRQCQCIFVRSTNI